MITRLIGRVSNCGPQSVVIAVGAISYELLIPAASAAQCAALTNTEVVFHTVHYLEGSLGGGNLTPRLIGFLTETDRAFFHELLRVNGVSTRKALRAMSAPTAAIAAAIERGDERFLKDLPEIGKKTAAQIVTELRGRMVPFVASEPAARPVAELSDAQRTALEILVTWGDRRSDAQRWIAAAVDAEPALASPEEIVRAAYRVKRQAPASGVL
ncbi:MAG: hypothetical protein JNG88_05130 [Phycisphaerales bacterium]|nr:hypothetical protein [Phycisphaerales bacterium]